MSKKTLVHTKATKLHSSQNCVYRLNLIKKHAQLYNHALTYYRYVGGETNNFRLDRFLSCRTSASFARNKTTGKVAILSTSCHLRFCPFCSKSKTNIIRRNVRDWLQHKKFPKFITLTLKSSDDDLRTQIDRLYNSFKKLRRLNLWKKAISSGVWFFQITKNRKTNRWHPHLHVIVYGNYIPRRKLSRAWHKSTGDSMVIDIRLIKDQNKASDYVARYASVPCNIMTLTIVEMEEIELSLYKKRICGSWGTAYKAKLLGKPKCDMNQWEFIGMFSTVVGMSEHDENASRILSAWQSDNCLSEAITTNFIDSVRRGSLPPPTENYEVVYDRY